MSNAAVSTIENAELSHNLHGQRLGRKGRVTRERILAAVERLLEAPGDAAISLSAVAREASLGMTTLYLYFSDLGELVLAALERVTAMAEDSYIAHLRTRWSDETLGEDCVGFVQAYHAFWVRHTRILHLRNSLADANDARMRDYRTQMAEPVVLLLVQQMDGDPGTTRTPTMAMASVMLTGLERLVTLATDASFSSLSSQSPRHIQNMLKAESRLIELGIRDCREKARLERGEA
jgi:AcrR family transcriptional regulator